MEQIKQALKLINYVENALKYKCAELENLLYEN